MSDCLTCRLSYKLTARQNCFILTHDVTPMSCKRYICQLLNNVLQPNTVQCLQIYKTTTNKLPIKGLPYRTENSSMPIIFALTITLIVWWHF